MDDVINLADEGSQASTDASLIIETILKLRAKRAQGVEVAQDYKDAIRDFEHVFAEQSRRTPRGTHRADRPHRMHACVQTVAQMVPADGVDLLVQAVQSPLAANTHLLETAVELLGKDSQSVVRESDYWMWVTCMNNLGCARTLLGGRRGGEEGFAEVEKAVDSFRALLSEPTVCDIPSEQATVLVNLSGALQALAELAMPAERLRYLASAFESFAGALSALAPDTYKGLLEAWRGVSA